MLTSLSGNAITAKARAIYGRRLKKDDYKELLKLDNISEVAAYLKDLPGYKEDLAGIDDVNIHRGQLELLLRRSLFRIFFSLCHYDFSRKKGFYHYIIEKAEIEIILNAIVHLGSGTPQEMISSIPAFMQEFVSFDFGKISNIQTYDDLLALLETTPYKGVLKPYAVQDGKVSTVACELALRTKYYNDTFEMIDTYYKGKTAQSLREIVQTEIDLSNINSIYRFKYLFHQPPDSIRDHILPFKGGILNDKRLNALLEDDEADASDDGAAEYKKKINLEAKSRKMRDVDFNFIENYTDHIMYFLTKKLLQFSSDAPIVFFTLMTYMTLQTQNLTIIIEGIRYGNSASEIENLLILD